MLTGVGKKRTARAAVVLTGTGAETVPGHIYWANTGNGTINVANLDGSNPRILVDQGQMVTTRGAGGRRQPHLLDRLHQWHDRCGQP